MLGSITFSNIDKVLYTSRHYIATPGVHVKVLLYCCLPNIQQSTINMGRLNDSRWTDTHTHTHSLPWSIDVSSLWVNSLKSQKGWQKGWQGSGVRGHGRVPF